MRPEDGERKRRTWGETEKVNSGPEGGDKGSLRLDEVQKGETNSDSTHTNIPA